MEFCVLVLMIGIHTCYGVSLCGNVSIQGKSLLLSRSATEFRTGCWCVLGLIGSNNDTVIVTEHIVPGGCQYMLQFNTSNGFSPHYSCVERGNFSFPLQHGGSVMLQLVVGHETTGGFTVNISFSTKSSNLSLTCNLPISITNPPAPAPRVTTTPAPRVTTTPAPRVTTTPAPRVTTTPAHRVIPTQSASTKTSDIAIIGGSVGGVCVIIAVVLILCCVIKRNKKRHTKSPEDTNRMNGAREELPIIMENDLYVSSDDVLRHNVSSDQDATSQSETNVEYAVVNKNKQPVYAVVNTNKKPVYAVVNKHTNTLKNNNDNDGDKSNFMIGPDGDQYTIVNKD